MADRGAPRSRALGPAGFTLASIIAVIVVVGGAFIVLTGALNQAAPSPPLPSLPAVSVGPTRDPSEPMTVASVQRYAHLVFQNVIRDPEYAQTALVPLDAPAGMRVYTGLECERVEYAADTGICLSAEHGAQSRYFAEVFGSDFVPTSKLELDGTPTYAAVSPDGSLAAVSVLLAPVTEEERLPPSKTVIISTTTGEPAADLDQFTVIRDGAPVEHAELDLWGVTFKPDGDGFFASLRLGGNIFLVEGTLSSKSMTVREPGVSAPSLSPDARRVAYARLISSVGPIWRFHVLDLQSGVDVELAEQRSIDDQIAWLDATHVLYGLSTDTWMVNADGSGTPEPFLFDGLSASVVRP